MNNKKHTPGPWIVEDEGAHELGPLIYPERKSGQPLALIYELKNHKADAHLIAQSPALLKALEDLLDVVQHVDREEWARALVRSQKVLAVDNAASAVAKANGQV